MSLIDCGLPEDMKVNSSVKIPAAGFPVNTGIQSSVVLRMAGCVTVGGPLNVLQAFERAASLSPDASAVACEGRKVTYRELNLSADRVARALRDAGSHPVPWLECFSIDLQTWLPPCSGYGRRAASTSHWIQRLPSSD